MMQHLSELSSILQPVGLQHLVEQHVLYPGQRRTQLVQAMMSRLLGGAVSEVQLAVADQYDGLPEDERFAKKCQHLLQLLGISATPEQLRGCSGHQDKDSAPLLQMARLLVAMDAQRGVSSSSKAPVQLQASDQDVQQQGDAGSISKVTHLLSAAAGQLAKLLSENVQLFPSDMANALKAYSDQGALAQLPQLCQHAVQRAQQLHQALQQLLGSGAAGCEGAGSTQWQQLVQDVDAKLGRQLQEMQAFDAVYQQELSVWAGGANSTQQQQPQQPWGTDLRAGSSDVVSAEATGLMARNLMGAYAELRAVLEAVATIMAQHQALKDVPVAALQQQRDKHFQETYNMRLGASAVRPL